MAYKDNINPKTLSEWFIRDEFLPFNIRSLLEALVEDRKYTFSGEPQWLDWPELAKRTGSGDDSDADDAEEPYDVKEALQVHVRRAKYINELIERAQSIKSQTSSDTGASANWSSSVKRWSGRYACEPVKDGSHSQDHCVLLDPSAAEMGGTTWYDVLVTLQYKSSKTQMDKAVRDIWSIATLLFASKARRFVLGVSMAGRHMKLLVFNRSAILLSESFDFHEHPEMFLRIVVGLAFLDGLQLGLDTSVTYPLERLDFSSPSDSSSEMSRPKEPRVVPTSIEFKGKVYAVIKPLNVRPRCVRERGTSCYLVKGPESGENLVMKDSWIDKSRESKEHDILKVLSDVEHITNLIDEEIVQLGDEYHTTETLLNKFLSSAEKKGTAVRLHRRYLFGPYCKPILSFRSKKELVNGFINWAEGMRSFSVC